MGVGMAASSVTTGLPQPGPQISALARNPRKVITIPGLPHADQMSALQTVQSVGRQPME